MSPLVRRILGESLPSSQALPVIPSTRPLSIFLCPHCQQEIHEKHCYDQDGVSFHSDCGGPIEFPQPDPAHIPAWLQPYLPT